MARLPFDPTLHFHFIGIGGSGMSGLARILLSAGYSVSGSDLKNSFLTKELESKGAKIFTGHSSQNLGTSDFVIYSSAVPENNPERKQAIKQGILTLSRSDFMNRMIQNYPFRIAITGTHGKTTTSSILAEILLRAKQDPLILLGSTASFIQSNAHYGQGNYAVFEACEAYGSLAHYRPNWIILTNIDWDHRDYFHSLEQLKEEFQNWIQNLASLISYPSEVILFMNADDPYSQELLQKIIKDFPNLQIKILSFGIQRGEYQARYIQYKSTGTQFQIFKKEKENQAGKEQEKEEYLASIDSPLYGEHNVYNVLSAFSLAVNLGNLELNLPFIRESISEYQGSQIRLEFMGKKIKKKNIDQSEETIAISIWRDYAHHPREIRATLSALRQKNQGSDSKILSIFQPHLYSRTKYFYREFAKALTESDEIVLLPIFPAREEPIEGVNSQLILEKIPHTKNVSLFESSESWQELFQYLSQKKWQEDWTILLLGAGDIHDYVPQILSAL